MVSDERQFDHNRRRGFSSLVCLGNRVCERRDGTGLLAVIGSVFLTIMVLTHFAEAFHLFPQMGCGLPHTAGHYIDFMSAWGGSHSLRSGISDRSFAAEFKHFLRFRRGRVIGQSRRQLGSSPR
jgi:hypothetical protein